MAVEARHLNLFPPQLNQDRELMNAITQGNGAAAAYNAQQMRFLGIPSAEALPENHFYHQAAAVCEAKTSVNTDSGLTYNFSTPSSTADVEQQLQQRVHPRSAEAAVHPEAAEAAVHRSAEAAVHLMESSMAGSTSLSNPEDEVNNLIQLVAARKTAVAGRTTAVAGKAAAVAAYRKLAAGQNGRCEREAPGFANKYLKLGYQDGGDYRTWH